MRSFEQRLPDFAARGVAVVAISVDSPKESLDLSRSQGYTFPLLSDPDRRVLTGYGAYGEKIMYGRPVQGVIRSSFVVDEKGKVEVAQYNVKATGHVAKLRRDLSI